MTIDTKREDTQKGKTHKKGRHTKRKDIQKEMTRERIRGRVKRVVGGDVM